MSARDNFLAGNYVRRESVWSGESASLTRGPIFSPLSFKTHAAGSILHCHSRARRYRLSYRWCSHKGETYRPCINGSSIEKKSKNRRKYTFFFSVRGRVEIRRNLARQYRTQERSLKKKKKDFNATFHVRDRTSSPYS